MAALNVALVLSQAGGGLGRVNSNSSDPLQPTISQFDLAALFR